MALSTVYDVKVRYSVDNRAGRGVQGLANDTKKLGAEVRNTSGLFGRLGAAAAAAFGVRAAGKALIGFNANIQETKTQIAGMLALTKKTDLSSEIGNADRLYSSLQKRAATLPGTTREYAQMLGMLTQPVTDAGLGLRSLEDLTVNAVVGAKALGVGWDVAARDIDQALRGQFHSVDQFTGKILGSIGYKGEDGRAKFNAMGAGERASELQRAMTQKQLTQLAAAQGASFSGSLSTLQDTIEQFLGKVGVPLFGAITEELKSWNGWISANADRVDDIAKSVGSGLVQGFKYVRDAIGFLVDHADLLIIAGKVWAGVKLGGMLAGGAGALATMAGGAGGGLAAWLKKDSDGFDKDGGYEVRKGGAGRQRVTAGNVMGNLGLIGSAALGGYALGNALGLDKVGGAIAEHFLDPTALAFQKLNRETQHLEESMRRAAAANPKAPTIVRTRKGLEGNALERANLVRDTDAAWRAMEASGTAADVARYVAKRGAMEQAGISSEDVQAAGGAGAFITAERAKAGNLGGGTQAMGLVGGAAYALGVRQLTEYQRETLDVAKAQNDVLAYMAREMKAGREFSPMTVMEMLRGATDDPTGKRSKSMGEKPKVNITIQRIEVQSDDPDRMAFGLIDAFRDAAKNPSSALSSLREG